MNARTITTLAATGVLAAGGAGIATAAATHHAAAPRATYQADLARSLGISADKLKAAQVKAGDQTVDALVAGGRIKADRAAKAKAQIAKGATPFAVRRGGAKPVAVAIRTLATQLGSTPKDVRTALAAGTTPAELIGRAGKDEATVAHAIQTAVRSSLQRRVTSGKLTAEKADARSEQITKRLTGDAKVGGRKHAKAG